MTKRNRLDDFHALQGVLGTKTLKIDVNHGSARRGLTLRTIKVRFYTPHTARIQLETE